MLQLQRKFRFSGCGDGKYLNVNKSIFNIGAEKSTRLSEVAHEKNSEVRKKYKKNKFPNA